jgi:hypothetical protein
VIKEENFRWRRQSRALSKDGDLGAVRYRAARTVIDPRWLEMFFPDPESRPPSHALAYQLGDPMLIQCEFLAAVE